VFLQLPHPLDSRVHDANLRLETIRVEQQAKAAGLFGDAGRQSVCSTLRVTPEWHPTPGDESEVPSARPRCRSVPINESHRQACSKDGIPRGKIVVTDRLNWLVSLQAPLAASPWKGRCGIVIPTYERAKMHEYIVTPDIIWETTIKAATFIWDEADILADLALDVGQHLAPLVIKAQRTRRTRKSFTLNVL